jgi:hypothetical protein
VKFPQRRKAKASIGSYQQRARVYVEENNQRVHRRALLVNFAEARTDAGATSAERCAAFGRVGWVVE